jgi:hypothetical protein
VEIASVEVIGLQGIAASAAEENSEQ